MTDSAAVPSDWNVCNGNVLLADVARSTRRYGVNYEALSTAARRGLLKVAHVGGRGRGGARHIAISDALLVIAVAALCSLLQIAFYPLLRGVLESGAQLGPAGLTIPLRVAP